MTKVLAEFTRTNSGMNFLTLFSHDSLSYAVSDLVAWPSVVHVSQPAYNIIEVFLESDLDIVSKNALKTKLRSIFQDSLELTDEA